jgi:hypothetical protein
LSHPKPEWPSIESGLQLYTGILGQNDEATARDSTVASVAVLKSYSAVLSPM